MLLGVGISLGVGTVSAYDDCYGDYLRCLDNGHPTFIFCQTLFSLIFTSISAVVMIGVSVDHQVQLKPSSVDNADKDAVVGNAGAICRGAKRLHCGVAKVKVVANQKSKLLQSRNISVQSITPEIAELSVNLGPEINKDLANRIIAATAIVHNTNLATADQNLIESGLLGIVW